VDDPEGQEGACPRERERERARVHQQREPDRRRRLRTREQQAHRNPVHEKRQERCSGEEADTECGQHEPHRRRSTEPLDAKRHEQRAERGVCQQERSGRRQQRHHHRMLPEHRQPGTERRSLPTMARAARAAPGLRRGDGYGREQVGRDVDRDEPTEPDGKEQRGTHRAADEPRGAVRDGVQRVRARKRWASADHGRNVGLHRGHEDNGGRALDEPAARPPASLVRLARTDRFRAVVNALVGADRDPPSWPAASSTFSPGSARCSAWNPAPRTGGGCSTRCCSSACIPPRNRNARDRRDRRYTRDRGAGDQRYRPAGRDGGSGRASDAERPRNGTRMIAGEATVLP
jgi:hypothetical protein